MSEFIENHAKTPASTLLRVHHTGAFRGNGARVDITSPLSEVTIHGEDIATTSSILHGLVEAGFPFQVSNEKYVPRIVAGIKAERAYRRDCHRAILELGQTAARPLVGGMVERDHAASMLQEFIDTPPPKKNDIKVGLELGHIELFSNHKVSANTSRLYLESLGRQIAGVLPYETFDATRIPESHKAVGVPTTIKEKNLDKEIKVYRGGTNFPILDIGKTGVQLFVRVAVGFEREDLAQQSLKDVREAQEIFMKDYADGIESGKKAMDHQDQEIVTVHKLDTGILAYPIAATLVALKRPQ